MTRLPFTKSLSQACKHLDEIHSDVWGPAPIDSNGGYKYYVIFIDEFTRFTWFYPIKHKFYHVSFPLPILCKIFLVQRLKSCARIVVVNMPVLNFKLIVLIMTYFINTLVHTPHNRMVLSSASTVTLWILPSP